MIADARYVFERNTGLLTSYILQEHTGKSFPGFPAVYVRIPKNRAGSYPELKGKQYVNFRTMENKLNPDQRSKWEYCLALASAKYPCGLNFPNGTRRAAGNNRSMPGRNDAYLLEFSKDWNQLTLYVFFKRANDAEALLKNWNCGQEITVAE